MNRRDLLKMACVTPLAPTLLLDTEDVKPRNNWNFEIHDWDTEINIDRYGLFKFHERYWVHCYLSKEDHAHALFLKTNGTLSNIAGPKFGYFKTKEDAQKMINKFVKQFPNKNIITTLRRMGSKPPELEIDKDGAKIILCCR